MTWLDLLQHQMTPRRLQKLIRGFQDARGEGEEGRGRPQHQPMKIQLLAPLTSRPRPRSRPIEIRLAGLPAKRPDLGQWPMAFQEISLEPGVLQ